MTGSLAPCAATMKTPAEPAKPMHDARDLLCGQTTASIALDGQLYTLRITRAGKLILTK